MKKVGWEEFKNEQMSEVLFLRKEIEGQYIKISIKPKKLEGAKEKDATILKIVLEDISVCKIASEDKEKALNYESFSYRIP